MSARTLVGAVTLIALLALAYYASREPATPDAELASRAGAEARRVVPGATPPDPAPAAQQQLRLAPAPEALPPQPPPAATIEQIRSATIPLERALAGLEELKLRVQFRPMDEFRETLLAFVAETDDPQWAPATEAHILRQISEATGLSASDVQVDCRTTLCRVLLTRPVSAPGARYNGFHDLVTSFGLQPATMLALPDETGTPINFAYLRRTER